MRATWSSPLAGLLRLEKDRSVCKRVLGYTYTVTLTTHLPVSDCEFLYRRV